MPSTKKNGDRCSTCTEAEINDLLVVDSCQTCQGQKPVNANLKCAICGDGADGQHFGADACRACAAFFRRTIARRLKYICRFEDDCDVSKTSRSLCRSCRLTKCYQVGMKAKAVRSQCMDIVRPPPRKNPLKQVDGGQHNTDIKPYIPSHSQHNSNNMVTTWSDSSVICSAPASGVICSTADGTQRACDGGHPMELDVLGEATAVIAYEMDERSFHSNSTTSSEAGSPSSPSSSFSPLDGQPPSNLQLPPLAATPFDASRPKALQDIVEISAADYFVDVNALPPSHPTLTKMLIGYEGLQRRRDVHFCRAREYDGCTTRVFVEKQIFDAHAYWQNTKADMEFIAEMLSTFDGYRMLPTADKMEVFKSYWIQFVILERNFDSFRVLGPSLDDLRIVFPYGDIVDVFKCDYDIKTITEYPLEEIRKLIHPWYKMSAEQLLHPLKRLGPTDVELMFCLGVMLWKLSAEVASKVTPQTVALAEQMVEAFYSELEAYYISMMPNVNQVRRVAELMRLISLTEKIAMQRREDMMLSKTFHTFKVDVYFEELFENN